jgi:hypothetical protein
MIPHLAALVLLTLIFSLIPILIGCTFAALFGLPARWRKHRSRSRW